jgi:GT2 family glycosyltransferase
MTGGPHVDYHPEVVPVPLLQPRVDVILLNWNKSAATLACVAALRAQTYGNARILVIDNGSAAEDFAALTAAEPDGGFVLLRHKHNLGFTGGVNSGIARAMEDGAAYVWLHNNDAIASPDTLSRLVAAAEADIKIGLVSPVIRDSTDAEAIDYCGGLVFSRPLNFERTADPVLSAAWMRDYPERIWLAGTALLIRRALIEAIGGLDDRFFAYWDDSDYSLRSLNAGFCNIVVLDANIRHETSPAAAIRQRPPYFYYYMARNEILLLRKHGGAWRNVRSLRWCLLRQWRLLARLRTYPGARAGVWAGLRDGLLGRGGASRSI